MTDPHDIAARLARLENLTRPYGGLDELDRRLVSIEERLAALEMALKDRNGP